VANTLDMILDHVLALQRRTLALQTIVERAQLVLRWHCGVEKELA